MEITGQWLLGIKLRSSRLKLSHVSPPPHSQHLLVRQTLQLTQSMTCWLDMLTSNPPAPPFSASLVPGCQTDGIRPWFHLSSEAQPSGGGSSYSQGKCFNNCTFSPTKGVTSRAPGCPPGDKVSEASWSPTSPNEWLAHG